MCPDFWLPVNLIGVGNSIQIGKNRQNTKAGNVDTLWITITMLSK